MLINLVDKDPDVIKAVADLWLTVNLEVHDFVDPAYWTSHYDDVLSAFHEANMVLYQEDNRLLGFIGMTGDYIAGIFIEKESRHKGIGSLLLTYLKSQHKSLTLSVYSRNSQAIQFYKRHGFQFIEKCLDEETHEKEWLMTWTAT